MLRGRKILYKKKEVHKEPIVIEKVIPVIASSLAGSTDVPVVKLNLDDKEQNNTIKPAKKVEGSKVPATIFMIIVFILGFYVIYDQFINDEKTVVTDTDGQVISKIDATKDYIYFVNEKDISFPIDNAVSYTSKEITINIDSDSARSLTEKLNSESANYIKSYEYSEDASDECLVNASIYNTTTSYLKSFTYRKYITYESDNYLSIVVIDSSIDICSDNKAKTTTTYVIDKTSGIVYTETGLLSLYDTTKESLVRKAVIKRTDGDYATRSTDEIVAEIIQGAEISLYIDSKDCLGIYYTGIMNDTVDDHANTSIMCK